MSDLWKRELAELRAKIKELDDKCEELLAAGPIAPGVVEAAAELAHEAAQLEERLTQPKSPPTPGGRAGEPKAVDAPDAQAGAPEDESR